MVPTVAECQVCKRLFNPKRANHIFCSPKCSSTKYRNDAKNNKGHGKKKKAKEGKSLAELSAEAKAAGMTYGKYVSLLEMGVKL